MTTSLEHPIATDRLRSLLEEGERRASQGGEPVLVSLAVRADPIDAIAMFASEEKAERALWEQPESEFSLVAVGAAYRVGGRGLGALSRVAREWRRRVSTAVVDGDESCPVAAPLAMGGVAFDPAGRRSPSPWEAFPDAELIVPRLLFVSSLGECWLTVSALATPGCDALEIAGETERVLHEAFSGDGAGASERMEEVEASLEEGEGRAEWSEAVHSALTEIRGGGLEKVVLAREVSLETDTPLIAGHSLRKLRTGYPSCSLFAFAREGSCFLGASPERLVRLQGRLLESVCLAGSRPRGATSAEDEALGESLLTDRKERHEHALVVRAVREALEPLTSRLSMPADPGLLRMANVQHLYTPVEGATTGETTVLDAVERLNPTPATGGLPRDGALDFIRRTERFDRGWYAGAVGWVDRSGEGEFAVAIRSALVRGSAAHLYAGCGIVADSDPERELEESRVKLEPLRWALGGQ